MGATFGAGLRPGPKQPRAMPNQCAQCAATGNNSAVLSNIRPLNLRLILNNTQQKQIVAGMRHTIAPFVIGALMMVGQVAHAACYADYKARKDNPLQLHYGVAQVQGACTKDTATAQLRPRLAAAGWQLLTVVSVFDDGGLPSRQGAAGAFFLRF